MTPHPFFARRRSVQLTSPSMQRQRGLATILIIITISLAMTAAAFGAIYSLRSNQNMQVTAHAQTHSQASAWAGVEVFRKYLAQLAETPTSLVSLADSDDLVMSIANTDQALSLKAEILKVQEPADITVDDTYEVTANIHSVDGFAKSSSVVQVLYRVSPFSCSSDAELDATLDFYRDLDVSGDVDILTDDGETEGTDFYVDGNITLEHISTSGISSLRSTGNVLLGSSVDIPEVYANGDITMEGAATTIKAYAVGSLTVTGNANISGEAFINNDISFGGGTSGDLNSLANIDMNSGGAEVGALNAAGQVKISQAKEVGSISAKGDIVIEQWISAVGDMLTESDVSCDNAYWPNFSSIEAQGSVDNCYNRNVTTGVDVDVTNMDPVEPFDIVAVTVDAWSVRSRANYLFEWDDVKEQIQVTVKDINTIPDGVYYIGENFTDNTDDYLCDALDDTGKCTSAPIAKICQGFSANNICFSYDDTGTVFTIDAQSIAPGIVWVTGDLVLANGVYVNTFVASGNITTAASHKTYGLNFAGYDGSDFYPGEPADVANNIDATPSIPASPSGVCAGLSGLSPNFIELYPTNFCDVANNTFLTNSLGNLALLAGGNNPNAGDAYEGGNITLGASTEIFGTILAGNYLFTEGDTTVHGYVSASGSGAEIIGEQNELGSSTTIDLRQLPDTFDREIIPEMGQGSSCEIPDDSEVVRTFWTKYL